ncbi:hypothetical protein FACS1894216_04290 [Synergistales bacterium]|nr:hypothetical protein FACS1894216_04290 [Synergistales bacterium]
MKTAELKMKLKESLALKFTAIMILPILALLWQPIVNFTVLSLGDSVLLRTRPVDPRDFLRGDYVILDYEVSDITDLLSRQNKRDDSDEKYEDYETYIYSGRNYRELKTVYVTLELDKYGVGTAASASFTPPSEGIYLKGLRTGFSGSSSVDYGIGVYYIPEGTGAELERAIQDSRILADVRILRGKAVIRGLKVEKK